MTSRQTERVERWYDGVFVKQAHHDFLAVLRGKGRYAKDDVAGLALDREPAVLRPSFVGDVHAGQDFHPAGEGGIHPLGQMRDGGQQAIEPVANRDVIVARFDVHVARVALSGGACEQVDEVHHRHRATEMLQCRDRIIGVVRGGEGGGGGAGREAENFFSRVEDTPGGRRGIHLCSWLSSLSAHAGACRPVQIFRVSA